MPASLSREDVLRIAELARLELTPDEVALFTRQLAGILEYVAQIQRLDTTGVPPPRRPSISRSTVTMIRRPTLPREEALANAPEAATEAGLFKVPRVMA